MTLSSLILHEYDKLRQIRSAIAPGTEIAISGMADTQRRHFASVLAEESGRKGIFVAWNEMQARQAMADFQHFYGDDVLFLPNRDIMLYDIEARSHEQTNARVKALTKLRSGDFRMLVTSIEATLHLLMQPDDFTNFSMELRVGEDVIMDEIIKRLLVMGYASEEKVEGPGQFARRGGILDIFPVNQELPCRIEFFDTEIDAMRLFSPTTQRSIESIQSLALCPAREILFLEEDIPAVESRIRSALEKSLTRMPVEYKRQTEQHINGYLDKFHESHYFSGIDKFLPWLIEKPATIFDYITHPSLLFFEDTERLKERITGETEELHNLCETMIEKSMMLPGSFGLLHDEDELFQAAFRHPVITFSLLGEDSGLRGNAPMAIEIPGSAINPYAGHMDLLVKDLNTWHEEQTRVLILVSAPDRAKRLEAELSENGISGVVITDEGFARDEDTTQVFTRKTAQWPVGAKVVIAAGALQSGFIYKDIQLAVVCESDIEAGKKRRRIRKNMQGKRISAFTDLKVGDFVVHQSHGVGVYQGIEQLVVEGVRRDYLKIAYKDNGSLFIPSTAMDLVQKFIGAEGREPKLNKLGGAEWAKAKTRVRESLRELADMLIKIQAERKAKLGHAFSPDTVWQSQFEELFPWEETPDQLKCIEEIKQDMESAYIMDRLLCGDVGYGKTEVAIRAVFKAVMDGKQAAFLVPTTVLANQHYENFKKRFSGFPVKVDMLSRFKTDSGQRQVIRDMRSGRTDVLVGTHMMLGKEVGFKDLGLLVIDEEQRFGVEHKEAIKEKYPLVDLLTLSATPIPRTLNMSLSGIRDISTLEDPPLERYPVQTYVLEYRDEIVRDAINRELARDGQVFYLFNRVRGIHQRVNALSQLVPEARVGYAHGQMGERELERVINSFQDKEFDVLVCTTIIESGIDMPNVNTIVVEDSDRLGLAQLYQIRGRVGRSNRLAYAYLTYRKDKVLGELAEKRLKAIREFTEFGSGFKIAMRDLQIRGAGNLLGAEQHGHMESVGYDMYLRLLEEAVAERSGHLEARRTQDVLVEFPVSAYIDKAYIQDEDQRIDMYKTISAIRTMEDLVDVRDELIDRYGDIPPETLCLMDIAHVKNMAGSCGFSSVKDRTEAVILTFSEDGILPIALLAPVINDWKGNLMFSAGKQPYLSLRTRGDDVLKRLSNIKILLQGLEKLQP